MPTIPANKNDANQAVAQFARLREAEQAAADAMMHRRWADAATALAACAASADTSANRREYLHSAAAMAMLSGDNARNMLDQAIGHLNNLLAAIDGAEDEARIFLDHAKGRHHA